MFATVWQNMGRYNVKLNKTNPNRCSISLNGFTSPTRHLSHLKWVICISSTLHSIVSFWPSDKLKCSNQLVFYLLLRMVHFLLARETKAYEKRIRSRISHRVEWKLGQPFCQLYLRSTIGISCLEKNRFGLFHVLIRTHTDRWQYSAAAQQRIVRRFFLHCESVMMFI